MTSWVGPQFVQVIWTLPMKFYRVNWPFDSGEVQNRFSRSQPCQPSCSLEQICFTYFSRESPRQYSCEIQLKLTQDCRRRVFVLKSIRSHFGQFKLIFWSAHIHLYCLWSIPPHLVNSFILVFLFSFWSIRS